MDSRVERLMILAGYARALSHNVLLELEETARIVVSNDPMDLRIKNKLAGVVSEMNRVKDVLPELVRAVDVFIRAVEQDRYYRTVARKGGLQEPGFEQPSAEHLKQKSCKP